jgi:hypothetical protein
MRRGWGERLLAALVVAAWAAAQLAGGAEPARLIEVRRIWDRAPHNAFTDLVRHGAQWYCAFREGADHVSPDGALQVLTSADGREWESAVRMTSPRGDLRDAKLTVTPGGRLMLSGAEALHDRRKMSHQSLAWFSDDGRTWTEAAAIGEPDLWLWRVTWHRGRAYGIGYGTGRDQFVRLYASDDGRRFETLVPRLFDEGSPNETSLVFAGEQAVCLLRRDGPGAGGMVGTAAAPYTKWEWKDLGVRIGGPHLIRLPDGRLVAAVRLVAPRARTVLGRLDAEAGRLEEWLTLPSGGDTSYAGLVWHEERLWVSYYSSHEGRTSIYLAQVAVGPK